MKKTLLIFVLLAGAMNTPSLFAQQPAGSEYISGKDSGVALILAHGKGKHPTWKVVEPLRKGVNEILGYHTLSLQMPNEEVNWEKYADDFPAAYAMFKEGIRFLKNEHGVSRIYLMGHSMGSRMASAFVSDNPDQPIAGLIVAGCRNNGEPPLSCLPSLQKINIPVLDIWGGGNGKDSNAALEREGLVSSSYKQVEIPDANHRFDGSEPALVSAVVTWLKSQ